MIVTCDMLQRALVIPVESLLAIMQEHGIMPGTEKFYAEMASAFQKQCLLPEGERRLWNLHWPEFLDRRLMVIVKLEILPSKGN